MAQNAVYRGGQAHVIDADHPDTVLLDHGDGLRFRVDWADEHLTIDPTDGEWFEARPILEPLPGEVITEDDGTTSIVVELPPDPDKVALLERAMTEAGAIGKAYAEKLAERLP